MERLAAQARSLEGQSKLMEARAAWLSILPFLPPESKQAEWIRSHARDLETAAPGAQGPGAPARSSWVKRLAPLGPLAVVAAKFKSVLLILFKLKFLLSFAAFVSLYWAMWGPRFGVGFAILVLIHEMGHFIDIKRRGLPANMPVFLPGLGAFVSWNALGVSLETRAAIALAGPLAGLIAAVACAFLWRETGDGLWAALSRTGAWLNVLNLTPIWIFDGALAARSLRKIERPLVLAVSLALGYATQQRIFYIVAGGGVWLVLSSLFQRRAQAQKAVRLGLNQAVAVTGPVSNPEAPLAQPESHFIAAYFLAVLTGLAMVLWLVPGPGTVLP